LIILNQLLRWRRRSQRVRVQFAGLVTFLPTKALALEVKYDHGLAALALILFVRSVREHSA